MYKTELIRRVAAKERLAQNIVADVLNATHRLIESELRAGNAVIFPSFGKFYPSKRKGGAQQMPNSSIWQIVVQSRWRWARLARHRWTEC
jgi:nucleoid DNA-binding protein